MVLDSEAVNSSEAALSQLMCDVSSEAEYNQLTASSVSSLRNRETLWVQGSFDALRPRSARCQRVSFLNPFSS